MTLSQRTAYGETLVELGAANKNIVVLEADLSKSTMGALFGKAYPERFFDLGIAEANMASAAAGLSLVGKIPFMASFAVFSTGRCYDQIRTSICIPALNVKICGSSAGLSDYGDGSTHQSIDDLALMRVLPNMQVLVPADALQTKHMLEYMAANPGPMYIRISRNDLPILTADEPFVPGAVQTVRDGSDAVILTCGAMLPRSVEAADLLAEESGVSVRVVNVPCVKPLDAGALMAACEGVRAVITVEEHSVIGGFGSAVAEALKGARKMRIVGVRDSFGTSAENYEVLLEKYGLTAAQIAAEVGAELEAVK